MSASLLNVLKLVPVPIFGTAATAFQFGAKKATSAPRYAQWALPAVAGGIWFVWPAVDEEWKQSILSGSSAEELAATSADESKVVLSEEAKEKIEKAYVVESESETAESFSDAEKEVMKAAQMGDFTLLEKEWDSFQLKASNPEEDDDDVSLSIFISTGCALFLNENANFSICSVPLSGR
jgi:hypothetical protein